ncbi:MAG: hypothetical protein KL863_16530 [Rhizobium sp.]|nr:hypothetical protein [Rhizobium sp.]
MSKLNLAIVIDEMHLPDTDKIAEAMARQGLEVEAVDRVTGAVFGSGDEAIMKDLRLIEGVEEVRPEGAVQLPPLSEHIPQ